MVRSLLLYCTGTQQLHGAIQIGVGLAARYEARVRAMTLLDTRYATSLANTAEAAIYCSTEFQRLDRLDRNQNAVRSHLSTACLEAGINFDVRRVKGDPFKLLPRESQLHDLTIVELASSADRNGDHSSLTASDAIELLAHGVQPLLVLRNPKRSIRRVLLVGDGTRASTTAVRKYLSQNLFPRVEHRLLAVGENEAQAKDLLHDLAECAQHHHLACESGWLVGAVRQVLLPYAVKWEADLVVTGVGKQHPLLLPIWRQPAEQILKKTSICLYAMT